MSRASLLTEKVAGFSQRRRLPMLASIGLLTVAGIVSAASSGTDSGRAGGLVPSLSFFGGGDDNSEQSSALGTGTNARKESEDGVGASGASGASGDKAGGTGEKAGGEPRGAIGDQSPGAGGPDAGKPDVAPGSETGKPGSTTSPQPSKVAPTWWKPQPGVTWQWQLTALPIDTDVDADVFDVDLFDVDASTIAALHKKGRKVLCYLSAGSYEEWRPDAASFPEAVLGNTNGWPGERWLDIRAIGVLTPIMEARFDLCRSKGFDGVEVDNVDGYTNGTGFPLSPDDQLRYNRMLAKAAHERGLAIALKNDTDQIPQLVGDFDLAVNEECAAYNECEALTPFIKAGKAVLHAEYNLDPDAFCAKTSALGLSSIRKNLELDAWVETCS